MRVPKTFDKASRSLTGAKPLHNLAFGLRQHSKRGWVAKRGATAAVVGCCASHANHYGSLTGLVAFHRRCAPAEWTITWSGHAAIPTTLNDDR
jgi:hypothetical protein